MHIRLHMHIRHFSLTWDICTKVVICASAYCILPCVAGYTSLISVVAYGAATHQAFSSYSSADNYKPGVLDLFNYSVRKGKRGKGRF